MSPFSERDIDSYQQGTVLGAQLNLCATGISGYKTILLVLC